MPSNQQKKSNINIINGMQTLTICKKKPLSDNGWGVDRSNQARKETMRSLSLALREKKDK